MTAPVLTMMYPEPPICEKEILRYAGCKECDEEIRKLLDECLIIVKNKLTYKVCYIELPTHIEGAICDFGALKTESKMLAENLRNCNKTIIFAATVGVELDRLIAKYGRISPSKAVMLQAMGAERIEALCDTFCNDLKNDNSTPLRPRFSPGYGDLPLSVQKQIFSLLDCEKRIGLTLNDSLLMSPTKSVTAFVGLGGQERSQKNKCSECTMISCSYRGI